MYTIPYQQIKRSTCRLRRLQLAVAKKRGSTTLLPLRSALEAAGAAVSTTLLPPRSALEAAVAAVCCCGSCVLLCCMLLWQLLSPSTAQQQEKTRHNIGGPQGPYMPQGLHLRRWHNMARRAFHWTTAPPLTDNTTTQKIIRRPRTRGACKKLQG